MAEARKRRRRKAAAASETQKATPGMVDVSGGPPPTDKAVQVGGALDEFLEPTKAAAPSVPSFTDVRWGAVADTVFELDPVELSERLTRELRLGNFNSDYGRLKQAVDDAAANLYDAKRLERAAKLEEQSFKLKAETEIEVMRTQARKILTQNREKGSGAITKQQVQDKMVELWPGAYAGYRKREARLHAMGRVFEGLVDAWNHRNSQLKIMLERAAVGRVGSRRES